MTTKYYLLHTGYPVAGRPIQPNEWKVKSRHSTESAAWKAMQQAKAHLNPGQWDDHYMVIDKAGNHYDYYSWWASQTTKKG